MSLVDPNYNGPYKCWSCRELYTLQIHNDTVDSLTPLSQEEYEKTHPAKPPSTMNISNARFGSGSSNNPPPRRNLF